MSNFGLLWPFICLNETLKYVILVQYEYVIILAKYKICLYLYFCQLNIVGTNVLYP